MSNINPAVSLLDDKAAKRRAEKIAVIPDTESAAELIHKQFAPVEWIVEGIFPAGCALLAGKPKSGKSWVALNLAVCVALGLNFLSKAVHEGEALYLALEDNERRLRRRLDLLIKDYYDKEYLLERLHYRIDWRRGAVGADDLEEWLKAHPNTRVVIIDTLKMIRPQTDGRRNAYDTDYESVQPWKAVADKFGVLLLIVHHTRKAEGEDVFDEVSGTLGLTGGVDQMVILKRSVSAGNQAVLHARGRDLEEDIELALELKDGWWESLGDASKVMLDESRRSILDELREEVVGLKAVDLAKRLNKRSLPSLRKLLKRMGSDGLIYEENSFWKIK